MGTIVHGGGRTTSLETAVMDLADLGMRPRQIADQLGEPYSRVQSVHGYMSETSAERQYRRALKLSSESYLAAVAATGGAFR